MKLFKESISNKASQFLNSYFKKDNILFFMEQIEIEGCNKYGVNGRSYILYVLSDKDGEFVLYTFCREEWYDDKTDEFELINRTILDLVGPTSLNMLNDNLKYIDNINLISKIKEKYKNIN